MKKLFTTRSLAQLKLGRLLVKSCLVILAIFAVNSNSFAQAVSPGVAPMAPPPGGFGIDGDLRALFPAPGTFSLAGDWLPSGCPALPVNGVLQCNGDTIPNLPKPFKAYHFVDQFSTGDDVFSGGEKKNTYIQNISWKNGNPSPAKTDINHFMMHIANDLNNDVWIVLAGDREEITGNSFISLQFLQEKLRQVSSPSKSFVSDAPASTGGRTEGDLQISAEFTGGGGNPNLYLERWEKPQGSQVYKWVSKSYSPGDALGAVNSSILTNNAYTMFGTNTYQPNAFIEVAVNISDIIEDVSGQECFGKISTLWVQTKTSQSETAALSDFVTPIQINLDINLEPDAGPDKAVCAGGSTTIGTAAQNGITYSWSPSTGLSDANIAQPTATPSATTEYTLTISQTGSNSNCNFTDKVTVTVNPNPTITGLSIGDICAGTTSASLAYTGLTGGPNQYKIDWDAGGPADVSTYTSLPSSPISIPNTGSLTAGTYNGTIYVKNSTTGCESSGDPISLVVNAIPDILNLAIDPICEGETSASITYTGVTNGANQYKIDWETGGPADVSTFTTLPASPITIPNTGSLDPGSYDGDLYVKNSTTGCISVVKVVVLVVNANPAGPEVEYIAPLCYQSTFSIKIKGVAQGNKYTILDKNGSTINGKIGATLVADLTIPYPAPNANDIVVTDIPAGAGYQVKIENVAGCESGFTSCAIPNGNRQAAPITQPALGNADKDLIAYPVPFSESVTVEFRATKAENYVINLYDLQGRLVSELKVGNAIAGEVIKVQVSGSGMAESMYLVRKISKSGISTVKLLKKE